MILVFASYLPEKAIFPHLWIDCMSVMKSKDKETSFLTDRRVGVASHYFSKLCWQTYVCVCVCVCVLQITQKDLAGGREEQGETAM